MKSLFSLLLCCITGIGYAQTDTSAGAYFQEIKAIGLHQQVWRLPLYGPMLLVDPQTRHVFANEPDAGGLLKATGDGVYTGTLPGDVIIANTAITWQGKSWSVILWPLPEDKDDRLSLMAHESFHRIQDSLGLPPNSPSADHLATMQGRIYFLLELQALKAALSKPVDKRNADLENALAFREKRKQLFPGSFDKERILEMNEGLAEYTGVILGRAKENIPGYLAHNIDSAAARSTIIRSFVYVTGPLYGYMLYQRQSDWTAHVDGFSDFPLLIRKYYQLSAKQPSEQQLQQLAKKYNGDAISASEKGKEAVRLQKVKGYVELFTDKPRLVIKLIKPNVGFNPSNMFDLGSYGTVYPTAEVKDTWGKLTVASGGMLMKDWKVITLSTGTGVVLKDHVIEGPGWKIVLDDHWKLLQEDELHYSLEMLK